MSDQSDAESSTKRSTDEKDKVDIEDESEKVQVCVNELRALVAEEKNLTVRMDDGFMLRYLRSHDFKPKEAFEKMLKVYKFKAKNKEYFCSEPVSKYEDLMSLKYVTLLEDRNKNGSRIFLAKLDKIETERFHILDCIKYNDLWLELALDEEETQKTGIHFILDLGGIPMSLVKFFMSKHTLRSAAKEEMRPWKNLDIHVVNTSKLIDTLVNLVYPVLGSKIKQQIHFHGQDWSSLHKFIDAKVLPPEYGGSKPFIDYDKMKQHVYSNEQKLMELFSLEYKKS